MPDASNSLQLFFCHPHRLRRLFQTRQISKALERGPPARVPTSIRAAMIHKAQKFKPKMDRIDSPKMDGIGSAPQFGSDFQVIYAKRIPLRIHFKTVGWLFFRMYLGGGTRSVSK